MSLILANGDTLEKGNQNKKTGKENEGKEKMDEVEHLEHGD